MFLRVLKFEKDVKKIMVVSSSNQNFIQKTFTVIRIIRTYFDSNSDFSGLYP